MRSIRWFAATIVALAVLIAVAQDQTPIILEHANSLQSFESGGTRWQELRGDVVMVRDSLRVECQNALYYPDSGLVIFRDNVEFRDPSRTLLADQVIYNDFTQEVNATSNVRIYQQDTVSATAKRAVYKQRFKQAMLYDDVKIREERRRMVLTGDFGFLDHERNFGWVTGRPVLIERDSLRNIVTEIHGDTIVYDGEADQARVEGNVIVERDSLIASGSRLVYSTTDKDAVLTGDPQAERGPDVMTGDTLKLFFTDEQLSHVEVIGHAVATSPADSGFVEPRHKMEGQTMTLWVDSSRITSALIEGTAIATYYVRESAQPRGLNVTSGDKLRVFFEDKKIARIRVEGGTQGEYTPQRLVNIASSDTTRRSQRQFPSPPSLPRR